MNRFEIEVNHQEKMMRLHDIRLEAIASRSEHLVHAADRDIWQARSRVDANRRRRRELEWGGRIPPHP